MPTLLYVAAAGIIERDNLVLITFRNPSHENGNGGSWSIPGGRLEIGESLEDCLKREIMEETRLDIDILAPIATWFLASQQTIGVTFACNYINGDVQLNAEHADYKWIETDKLLDYIVKDSMIADIRAYLQWRAKEAR